MQRTHRIRLYPNNRQSTYFARCCGVARFAYNWGLARWNEMYAAHKANPDENPQPTRFVLNKELNSIKREKFPWMMEVTKYAPQVAIINLGRAYENYFNKRADEPTKKRKGVHDSFYIGSDMIAVVGDRVKIPGLGRFMDGRQKLGWVKMAERLRYANAKIICATVSRTADDWFISITCEVPEEKPIEIADRKDAVGIDVGVGEYVMSDGEFHQVPRAYRQAMRRLRRAQQSLSRKKKGSRNRWKQKRRIARIHQRIADVRGDWLHKLSNEITKNYKTVVLEDLNVRGMERNHHLALSVTDAAFGEFRRQVEYKAKQNGCNLVFADRWYPSSKTCSHCGAVKANLPLSERVFRCDECHFVCHRDLNAAINLKNLAASSAVSACGEFSANTRRQNPSGKQPQRSRKKTPCLTKG